MAFTSLSRDVKLGAEDPAWLPSGQLATHDLAAHPVPCVVVLPHPSLLTLQPVLAALSGISLSPVLPTLDTR